MSNTFPLSSKSSARKKACCVNVREGEGMGGGGGGGGEKNALEKIYRLLGGSLKPITAILMFIQM